MTKVTSSVQHKITLKGLAIFLPVCTILDMATYLLTCRHSAGNVVEFPPGTPGEVARSVL
jgi:hypothetical protein